MLRCFKSAKKPDPAGSQKVASALLPPCPVFHSSTVVHLLMQAALSQACALVVGLRPNIYAHICTKSQVQKSIEKQIAMNKTQLRYIASHCAGFMFQPCRPSPLCPSLKSSLALGSIQHKSGTRAHTHFVGLTSASVTRLACLKQPRR